MPVTAAEPCISELVLDELLAGELEASAEARAARHVAACPRCQARRTERERDSAAFLERAPTFAAHTTLLQRAPRPRRRGARAALVTAGGALALAASALLFVRTPADPGTRRKGAAHIGFFVKRGERVTRGSSGQTVYPGDELRFVYSSARDVHFALLNVDAQVASIYFPSRVSESPRVRAGSDVPLDFGVELDERLGSEQVHALFCPMPFALEPVRAALQAGAPLPAALAGCVHDIVRLHKQARP